MRSLFMSIPYTSQSVVARMRLDKWWPIKPFTPRIKTFFISFSLTIKLKFFRAILHSKFLSTYRHPIQFEVHYAQHATPADRIRLAFFHIKSRNRSNHCALGHQRLQNPHRLTQQPRSRARTRLCICCADCDQSIMPSSALRPPK